MRDNFYDERLGNRNWDAIRRKYADVAASAPDPDAFAIAVNLMLGELNASHLGFYPNRRGRSDRPDWNITTAHLGVRFDADHRGPGLKVKDVLPNSPADREVSKIEPGEIIVSIDNVNVDPEMDLTEVLNGPLDRDIQLSVRGDDDETRELTLRPISYGSVRSLLYEKWLRDNRQAVAELSDGTLGYAHIRGMNWPSFQKLERELYAQGAGKDGLVIDVRNNGGGFTADHVLTLLCQPAHAITVPRGGGPGYPEDRRVYATWTKPIVLLCNQNSFSNAEIISHAVKTLKRGKLVGVTTAGGVISTGGTSIMDVGFIRLPFRGWYVLPTGEDMELYGAVPDIILWPQPGDMPRGKDIQLEKAVEVLLEDVKEWKARPQPPLRKASERSQ
jgi:tricorn protease